MNGCLRRVSPISVCLGEGRLTQSTADLQPEKRELARAPAAGVPSARTEVHPQLQLSRAPSRDSNTGCSCPCTYAPSSESGRKKNQGRAVRQEPRHEGCPPGRGPVLKSAPCDDGRAYQIVLLFERPVVGKPAEQNNVFDPPAWPDASRCMLMEITPLSNFSQVSTRAELLDRGLPWLERALSRGFDV